MNGYSHNSNSYNDVTRIEEEESLQMALAIEASHESLRKDLEQQRSLKVARLLQQEEVDSELALAIKQSEDECTSRRINDAINSQVISQKVNRKEGCWDCLHCTFLNAPYEPRCHACGEKAPKHILTFQPMPSSIRFGVEIEILMSNGKKDGFTLKSIAKHLHQMSHPQQRVYFMGYTHQTMPDGCWKIVTDASIRENDSNNGDLCFELVSPVLCGDRGLKSLRSMMDNLRSLGIDANSSCGFHVHVDAEESSSSRHLLGNLKGLQSVCQCFVALENAFDLLVAHSWDSQDACHNRRANKNRFCKSNRFLAFQQQSNQQRWNTIANTTSKKQLVYLMNGRHSDRYRKLNLTNIIKHDRPSTVEFRQHGKVESTQEAEAWVRLILLFCQNSVTLPAKRNRCLLPQQSSTRNKDEMNALFQLIGCTGLQQLFVVDRRLFNEHRLLFNDWSCKVCRKRFRDCRSLSQHCTALNHHY